MDKPFFLFLIVVTCFFLSCKKADLPPASYQMKVDNELAKDTIDHNKSYKFEVINELTSNVETGTWEVQLLKQDCRYLTVVEEENSQELNIPACSLVEKIPTDQLFKYDGLRIKGRIFFNGNDGQVVVEKLFSVWGKPAKPVFYIVSAEENGYPDEMNIKFGFVCDGATGLFLNYQNEDYGEYTNFILTPGDYYETFNDLDMTTVNKFQICAINSLGTTKSDPIYIGGKYTLPARYVN